ncbi:hypothetical protein E4U32_001975 [Claviceps aff. humidiphila group G2b]|nr:hypothetical protein E4U32_001975 [Claviceps aff. humidiphila group G2b]
MASQFSMAQPLYRPANLTVDTHRVPQDYLEDDGESCMLDDAVDSGLGLSPPIANSRRQSFAMGSVLFSPKSEDWPSIDMRSVPSNQFADLNGRNNGNSHHPLMALNTAHSQIFPSQGNPWDLATGSACAQFNQMQESFNAGQAMFQRPLPSSFDNLGAIFPAMSSADPSIQRSPQKGWESPNQPIRKKRKTCSPVFPARDGLRKGDGIRKKNARADIPADRNLNTIDTLIAQSANEQETKVLKQQKRLLRNRQAALDSRQRKKQHTDHLEEENKELRSVNTGLEQELASLKSQVEMLAQEKTNLMSCVDRVTMEKEDAIRASTIETAELRKKVAVLTNHVQRLENRGIRNNASGVSNHHFSAGNYNGMNGMPGSWDNTSYTNDCSPSQQHQVRPQMSDMRPPKIEEPALPSETEKGSTSQGGLLFMLFLVGALVVSSRTMPTIPRVSEDVRAASATLLATVFKDAGISCLPESIRSMPPQPSGSAWSRSAHSAGAGAGADMNNADMDNAAAPSMLDDLGHALMRPTQEQMHQHIFSMSATQYDGVGNQDFLSEGLDTSQQSRKNLADALAAMRAASQHDQESAADVYTRSLLWEQIPLEVVRNFARLVAECNHGGILGGIAVQ